jgi:pyruvate dehydrogenase E2 component (dihydrolipoamide acetyltransferase)
MSFDVLMPPLSQTMDTMVLVEWLKNVGDSVRKGEPLFLVESDKATLEVESPATGVLAALLAEAGSDVPVRGRVAVIAAPGEDFPLGSMDLGSQAHRVTQTPENPQSEAAGRVSQSESSIDRIPLPAHRATRIFASPRARRAAVAHQVALEAVAASGPSGLIVERDVLAAAEQQQSRPGAERMPARVSPVAARVAEHLAVDLSGVAVTRGGRITRADVEAAASVVTEDGPAGMDGGIVLDPTRRTIARRLSAAHHSIVPVTLLRECDATELVALRERVVAALSEDEPRPTYSDFLAVAVARSLRTHPALNGTFDGERVYPSEAVHLGMAVETERGLLAPVIRSCERLGLLEIARERLRLAEAARNGSLASGEMAGGTFTLTNLGPMRVDAFTPVVNAPQIAILGVGRIRQAAAVHQGQLAVRDLVVLSLTFDHRVVDGAPAARFLDDVAALVERPDRLWLLPG